MSGQHQTRFAHRQRGGDRWSRPNLSSLLTILFAYPTISRLIGRLCANGAKAGIRAFLSGQDPDTIMNSVAGQQIMQNMNTRLIGRIQPLAIESLVH
ncbi:hypothetical protein C7271_11330 [filamentous cyanobacterium CCP5]|nr:hypothetical protein C7271_11330 [filamentous cyanobacterium CCP5]